MKSVFKDVLRTLSVSLFLFALVLCALFPASCRSAQESLDLLSGDFTVPSVSSCLVTDPRHVRLDFSKPVDARFLSLCRTGEGLSSDMSLSFSYADDDGSRKSLLIECGEELSVGEDFVLAGEISDMSGNTLTFSLPLKGFNDRVPVLAFSEVRNNWKNADSRAEYVEFYVLRGGNLSGLVFDNASKAGKRQYAFPAAEVREGEYIVLHLQTPADDGVPDSGAVDETGSDLSLSTVRADECSAAARDFWAPYAEKVLAATDILVLRDTNSGARIVDCLAYATEGKESQWTQGYSALASEIEQYGLWADGDGAVSCTVQDAADITALKSAATKSLSRRGVEALDPDALCSAARDWYVTQAKGYSPGRRN